MNRIKKFIEEAGWPRILIGVFLVILFILSEVWKRDEEEDEEEE